MVNTPGMVTDNIYFMRFDWPVDILLRQALGDRVKKNKKSNNNIKREND